MHIKPAIANRARQALVLVPGKLNYFYNQNGRRLAEALRELGFEVDLATLEEVPDRDYDTGLVAGITEVVLSQGQERAGIKKLREARRRCRTLAACSLDCVATQWYQRLAGLACSVQADAILDLGLHDQALSGSSPAYHFVLSGLTAAEQQQLTALAAAPEDRPIPWAFVAHQTPDRIALVDHLVQSVDPGGFVYLPTLAPYTESGSPHLNQEQLETVLQRTRYQIWCSHHPHLYMEPERFRLSLLTGSVPVKVVASKAGMPRNLPFHYLVMDRQELARCLRRSVFEQVRRRFWSDFQRIPSLARGLATFLANLGVPADSDQAEANGHRRESCSIPA